MNQNKRRRIYIQRQIQRNLAIRCIVYWVGCLVSVLLLLMIGESFSSDFSSVSEAMFSVWSNYSTAIFASLLLLPLVVWDMIKFSHRVVGPLIRLEREMAKLADGNSVRPLQFRKDDFWKGLSNQFNSLRMLHFQLKHQASICECDRNNSIGEPVVLTRYPV